MEDTQQESAEIARLNGVIETMRDRIGLGNDTEVRMSAEIEGLKNTIGLYLRRESECSRREVELLDQVEKMRGSLRAVAEEVRRS